MNTHRLHNLGHELLEITSSLNASDWISWLSATSDKSYQNVIAYQKTCKCHQKMEFLQKFYRHQDQSRSSDYKKLLPSSLVSFIKTPKRFTKNLQLSRCAILNLNLITQNKNGNGRKVGSFELTQTFEM